MPYVTFLIMFKTYFTMIFSWHNILWLLWHTIDTLIFLKTYFNINFVLCLWHTMTFYWFTIHWLYYSYWLDDTIWWLFHDKLYDDLFHALHGPLGPQWPLPSGPSPRFRDRSNHRKRSRQHSRSHTPLLDVAASPQWETLFPWWPPLLSPACRGAAAWPLGSPWRGPGGTRGINARVITLT